MQAAVGAPGNICSFNLLVLCLLLNKVLILN